MASWPTVIYPHMDSWREEMVYPVARLLTRTSAVSVRYGERGKWRGYGTLDLYDRNAYFAWREFLHAIGYGEQAFSMSSYLPHTRSVSLSAQNTAYLSEFVSNPNLDDDQPIIPQEWCYGWENVIRYSEDLSNVSYWAAVGGATVTRTSGQNDPFGGANAWRIQTTGGTYLVKFHNINTEILTSSGTYFGCGVWVRNISLTTSVKVNIRYGQSSDGITIAPLSDWTLCNIWSHQTTSYYAGIEFSALSTGASLDFLVFRPMVTLDYHACKRYDGTASYVPTTTTYYRIDPDHRIYLSSSSPSVLNAGCTARLYLQNVLLVNQSDQQSLTLTASQSVPFVNTVGVMLMEV